MYYFMDFQQEAQFEVFCSYQGATMVTGHLPRMVQDTAG